MPSGVTRGKIFFEFFLKSVPNVWTIGLGCGEDVCCVNVLSTKCLQTNLDMLAIKMLIIKVMFTLGHRCLVACLLPLVFSRTPLAIIATGLGWSSMLVIALGFATAQRLSGSRWGCLACSWRRVVAVGLQLAVLLDYLAAGDALEDATCRGCFHFPTCGGGCPYERIHNQHHPEQPADPCPHILGNLDAFMEAHIALRELQAKQE